MSELNLTSTISKRAELLSSEIDGEVVMMNIETGRYIGMNPVGSEVWKILEQGPSSIHRICKELLLNFKVDQSTCEQEVLSFCTQMLKENLIQLN
jgi:hypothetical protein